MELITFALTHRGLTWRFLALLLLPWIGLAYLMPAWAAMVATGLSVICWLLLLRLAAAGGDNIGPVPDEDIGSVPFAKLKKRTRIIQQVVVEMNALTDHWQRAGKQCRQALTDANLVLQQTMAATDKAAEEIGVGFNEIVSKTQQQTNIARKLLIGDEEVVSGGSPPGSHLDGYDQSLQRLNGEVQRFSAEISVIVDHQQRIGASVRGLGEFNDELRDLAGQISRIALDGSVAMTSQTHGPQEFIDMTDRIRAISEQVHLLTRRIRQGLESVADEVKATSRMTALAAASVQGAAQSAKVEVGQLTEETALRADRIRQAIKEINSIGESITTDINNIIVAIQFQDITHQKLEAVRDAVLGGADATLQRLAEETDLLLDKDRTKAVRAYSERAILRMAPQARATLARSES